MRIGGWGPSSHGGGNLAPTDVMVALPGAPTREVQIIQFLGLENGRDSYLPDGEPFALTAPDGGSERLGILGVEISNRIN
jgi:hypothetical protein